MCLGPASLAEDGSSTEGTQVLLRECSLNNLVWEFAPGGSLRHKSSRLCVHSANDGPPAIGTALVLKGSCVQPALVQTAAGA